MTEVIKEKTAQVRRCETGGSELWVWGEPKDGKCWTEGWHSPNPVAWWATMAEDWSLIGHKLMVVDTKTSEKSFFVYPNGYRYVGSDGTTQRFTGNACLSSCGNNEGGKGPIFMKLPDKGKGPNADHPKKKTKFTSPLEEPKQTWGEPKWSWSGDETWGAPSEARSSSQTWTSSVEIKPKQPAGPPPDYLIRKEVAPPPSTPPELQPSTPLDVQPSTPPELLPKRSHAIGVRPPPAIGERCPPS